MEAHKQMTQFSDIQGRAQNLIDEAERAISDAKIKEKAKTIWDTIVDLFQ